MIRAILASLVLLYATVPVSAQIVSPLDPLSGAVKKVAQVPPDVTGNVDLPTTFSGITMSSTALNGSTLINGSQAVSASTLATALAPYVTTVNGVAPIAGNVTIPATNFITGFSQVSPGTVANLISQAPCNAARLASYAIVSDLYSGAASTNEVMRCTLSGVTYYWRPQRTDYAANISYTGGTVTLTCMTNAPIMFLTGALSSNQTINLSPTNCWPGAQFSVANNLTLGIFGLTIGGLVGGTTKALGLNTRGTFYFDGTAWQSF